MCHFCEKIGTRKVCGLANRGKNENFVFKKRSTSVVCLNYCVLSLIFHCLRFNCMLIMKLSSS